MKILTHEGLQYFYNQIAAKFSTKEQTAEAIEEAVGNAGVGTVTSVNGKTGVVQLSASDVGALPASTQIPSIAGLATETYVDNKVASMVDSAPETLNTLNELAAALGDDPNFATTVATEIGGKVNKSGDTMTGQLTASGFSIKSDGWAMLRFYNAEGAETGGFYSNQDARQLSFFSKDKSGYNDYFKLPYPSGLTADGYYDILTSKNPVTIAQGGTGATTAQDAAHSLIRGNAIAPANIEFWPASDTATHGGYIDFHFNQASDDYTSRIIESAKGELSLNILGDVRVGNITYGNWKGSAIPVAYGGTGATDAITALTNLGAFGALGNAADFGSDLNNFTQIGAVLVSSDVANRPEGASVYGICWNVYGKANTYIEQHYVNAATLKRYVRFKIDNVWRTWAQEYDSNFKPTPAEIGAAASEHTHSDITDGAATARVGVAATPILIALKNGNNHWAIERAGDNINSLAWHYYNPSSGNWLGSSYLLDNNNFTTYVTPAAIGALPTNPDSIEFMPGTSANHGGFIDFHFNRSSADHTSRIIESSSSVLDINNVSGGKVRLGTVTAGTWNGSAIPIANGGTGAINEVTAANNLKVQSLGYGIDIPANANLNNYTTVGNYRCGSTSTGATIANCPVADAFTLQVYASTGTSASAPTTAGWAYFLQKFTTIEGAQYYRTIKFLNSATGTFGDWVKVYDSGNNKPTAADIGAVALNGNSTVNGTITATKVIGAVYA